MNRFKIAFLLITALGVTSSAFGHPHIIDVKQKTEVSFTQLQEDLAEAQVVLIGESHDHVGHHQMQSNIIKALNDQQVPLAIGLEMFQVDYQQDLDDWVSGKLNEEDFIAIYNQNWGWWEAYRPIFVYAREHAIPLIALNISRDIIRQVARNGFNSLSEEQVKGLKGAPCVVDPIYENFIRRALGSHGHNQRSFINFCEAQLLWDITMARHALEYLEKQPQAKLIILAGNGHSWKYGIAHQMEKLQRIDYRVVLPEVDGRLNRSNVNFEDTDYLWLDDGQGSWSVSSQSN